MREPEDVLDSIRERAAAINPALYFAPLEEQVDEVFKIAEEWIRYGEDACNDHRAKIETLEHENNAILSRLKDKETELKCTAEALASLRMRIKGLI